MRLPLVLAAALTTSAALAAPNPLAAYRWKARVVVAFAPDAADPLLVRQKQIFADFALQAKVRDLVLVEAIGDQGVALRRRFGVRSEGFEAILVGKDGEAKLRAERALDAAALFPLIDAMPMRRDEIRERGE